MSTVVAEEQIYDDGAGSVWWIFLITGTLWMILSLIMFRFNITSVNTIGVLAGIVFLIRGVIEFGMAVIVHGGWWKALNALLGHRLHVPVRRDLRPVRRVLRPHRALVGGLRKRFAGFA